MNPEDAGTEAFEITFFCAKEDSLLIHLDPFYAALKEKGAFGKRCLTDLFIEEHRDFIEIRLCIFNLIIKRDNFLETIKELSGYVSTIFEDICYVSFATGIYELTYYFTESIMSIDKLESVAREKFPLVFLREKNDSSQGEVVFEDENVVCIFNEEAQDLFAVL